MSVYAKLLEIQSKLKVPKGQHNNFGNYQYRSCEDIIEALKPLCHKANTVIILSDEAITLNGQNYIKATAMLIDTENDSKVENTAFAREEETKKGMDASQITGACSSYARKYALNGLFGIDDTKDSDSTNMHGKGEQPTINREDNKPIMCTTCGKEITGTTSTTGKSLTAIDVYYKTKGLCSECYAKSKAKIGY